MSRSYYVIELSARWLTVLLIALALVMIIAFALGYGAAWSVLTAEQPAGEMTALQAAATPTEIPEVVIPTAVAEAIAAPGSDRNSDLEPAAASADSNDATTDRNSGDHGFLRSGGWPYPRSASVDSARTKLEGLGFPRENQHLITVEDAGSPTLYQLRLGPFPDRASADRVAQRMSAAGFPDAWVVAP